MFKPTAKDLIALTLSELEDICALIMEVYSKGLVCPHCSSIHCVKNGSVRGKKRFVCRDCKKSFGTNPHSALAYSNLPAKTWKKYIQCMVNGYTLEKSAEIVGVRILW